MKVSRAIEIPRAFYFLLGLILIHAATFKTHALAQGQKDGQLLKMTYDVGDYQATARLASDMIARQPNNSFAHYYLGCSLARSGKNDAARKELAKCQSLASGTELGKCAGQALAALSPYDNRSDKSIVEPKLSSASTQERQRLLLEQDREMQAAEKRFDEKVNLLRKSATAEELKSATQQEYEQLSKDQAAITERYQRRADALLRRGSPSGSVGQATRPSSPNSSYVQNYVHSEDPSQAATIPTENPLKARALMLGEETGKGAALKTSGKQQPGGK